MADLFRGIARAIKNEMLDYDPIEVQVREATSNEPHAPSTSLMMEIANATYSYDNYPKMFNILWKRITDYPQIRHVQKSLFVVEFLLKHGNDRFVTDVRARANDISKLRSYKYIEEERDIAGGVRQKAAQVYAFLMDDTKLKAERDASKKLRGIPISPASNDPPKKSLRIKLKDEKKSKPEPEPEQDELSGEEPEEKPKPKKTTKPSVEDAPPKKIKIKGDLSEEKPKKTTAPVEEPKSKINIDLKAESVKKNIVTAPSKPVKIDEFDPLSQSSHTKALSKTEVDFLSSDLGKSNIGGDWSDAFAVAVSDQNKKMVIIDTKKEPGSFSFDEAMDFEEPEKSNDLWDKHSNLIATKDNVKDIKKSDTKGKSIRELAQEKNGGDFFDTIASKPKASPVPSPTPPAKEQPQVTGFDMYGLPIIAQPQVAASQKSSFPSSNAFALSNKPTYYASSQPVTSKAANSADPFAAAFAPNQPKKVVTSTDPFANITWK